MGDSRRHSRSLRRFAAALAVGTTAAFVLAGPALADLGLVGTADPVETATTTVDAASAATTAVETTVQTVVASTGDAEAPTDSTSSSLAPVTPTVDQLTETAAPTTAVTAPVTSAVVQTAESVSSAKQETVAPVTTTVGQTGAPVTQLAEQTVSPVQSTAAPLVADTTPLVDTLTGVTAGSTLDGTLDPLAETIGLTAEPILAGGERTLDTVMTGATSASAPVLAATVLAQNAGTSLAPFSASGVADPPVVTPSSYPPVSSERSRARRDAPRRQESATPFPTVVTPVFVLPSNLAGDVGAAVPGRRPVSASSRSPGSPGGPASPADGLSSAFASATGGGLFLLLLAVLTAIHVLAAPDAGRRLRLALAPRPLPTFALSLERPG